VQKIVSLFKLFKTFDRLFKTFDNNGVYFVILHLICAKNCQPVQTVQSFEQVPVQNFFPQNPTFNNFLGYKLRNCRDILMFLG